MTEVLVEQRGRTLVVSINRPEVRNAINVAAARGIAAAMDWLDEDDDLLVGVITGVGAGFCAGMDLRAFSAGERPAVEGRGFAGLVERPPSKPLIAAVEGFAVAGGFEIVLACDLVVAGRNARFGLPEVKRGLIAGGGGLLRLPQRVPHNVALEWALVGEMVTTSQLQAAGFLNRITEDGGALTSALALADTISRNAPLAVCATKRIVSEAPSWPVSEAFVRMQELYEPVRSSNDAVEGARAFAEKRSPQWSGS